MGGKSPPKPPSPQATAQAQTQSNIGTSIANQMLQGNQVTPWGNLTNEISGYTDFKDPASGKTYKIPKTTTTTTLSPQQQGILGAQQGAQGALATQAGRQAKGLGSILGVPMKAPNLSEVGAGPNLATSYGGAGGYSADRARVEKALMSRMNPALDQARQQRVAQLSNQGIKIGTEAFDRAMTQENERGNDAQMQAILAGGQEQSRLAGLDQARATFGNASRQQMFDNSMARTGFNNDARTGEFGMGQQARSGGINEILAMLGGGQVQSPQFAPTQGGGMPNTDMGALINNQYQGQMNAYNQQQQSRNQMMGGLFSAGTAMLPLMLSDERTKENVEPVGAEFAGNPVYEYNYIGDPDTRHVGVMAQDVKKTHPEAVVPMGRFLGVNYGKLAAVA
jgi:hypothetical protein